LERDKKMNRVIKFRVWDIEMKMWINNIGMSKNNILSHGNSKRFHIMQFTGLKDKNGVEIFEGDKIVNNDYPNVLIVGFNDESASFCGSKTNDFETKNYFWFFNDVIISDGWEIIGNIYENTELLK
jgi:uncharacterized phage protein (TIGR01671 family)